MHVKWNTTGTDPHCGKAKKEFKKKKKIERKLISYCFDAGGLFSRCQKAKKIYIYIK